MINALHSHDRHSLDRHSLDRQPDKHQDSMMASLAHRLEVARANNNTFLVNLLEREKQQVALAPPLNAGRSQANWWQRVTQRLTKALFGGSELQVHEMVDGSDRWWVASDPLTGQCVYADSEAELRLWIKENYHGR